MQFLVSLYNLINTKQFLCVLFCLVALVKTLFYILQKKTYKIVSHTIKVHRKWAKHTILKLNPKVSCLVLIMITIYITYWYIVVTWGVFYVATLWCCVLFYQGFFFCVYVLSKLYHSLITSIKNKSESLSLRVVTRQSRNSIHTGKEDDLIFFLFIQNT